MAHSPHPPQNTSGIVAALYPAEDFAELLTQNPDQAFALLKAMSPQQCEAQAQAYVAWLRRFGLNVSLELVREAWSVMSKADLSTRSNA